MVAPATPHDKRVNGYLRRFPIGNFIPRPAPVDHPGHHARVWDWCNDRFNKLLGIQLNLLNVLSFRLVLAIGVDYGIYLILVWQKTDDIEHDVAGVLKPVLLAGLTAVAGFGSLVLARNPSLSGLGSACAIGIFWSLVATIFFTLPAMAATEPKSLNEDHFPMR